MVVKYETFWLRDVLGPYTTWTLEPEEGAIRRTRDLRIHLPQPDRLGRYSYYFRIPVFFDANASSEDAQLWDRMLRFLVDQYPEMLEALLQDALRPARRHGIGQRRTLAC